MHLSAITTLAYTGTFVFLQKSLFLGASIYRYPHDP